MTHMLKAAFVVYLMVQMCLTDELLNTKNKTESKEEKFEELSMRAEVFPCEVKEVSNV